jgi:sec-independent protein translocase protein TatB
MFNVGGGELLVIAIVALIVLGPQKLPEAMRTVGRVVGELRRISSGFQQEIQDAIKDMDADATPRPRREAVPLAAVVADTETDAAAARRDADDDEDDDVAPATPLSPWGESAPVSGADGPSLAPAVADALDEIVTPLAPPAEAPAPDDPAPSSEGPVGDERAAS